LGRDACAPSRPVYFLYFKAFLKKQKRGERVDGKVFPTRGDARSEYVDFPPCAAFSKYAKQANNTRLRRSKQEKTPLSNSIFNEKKEKSSRPTSRQAVLF